METVDFANQESCHYLYAVVDSSATVGPKLKQFEISLVPYRDIACVITTVPTAEYSKEVPSGSAEQLDWVAPRVMKHHQVLMEMMDHMTIVPFKFGTLCASTGDVQAILASRYEQLRGLLQELQGKQEWVVSVYVDSGNLAQRLETHKQIQELDSLIMQRTGGEAYLLRKKKEKISSALRQSLLQQIHDDCCQRFNEIGADLIVQRQCGTSTDPSIQVLSASVLSASGNFEVLERTAWEIENHYFHYCASVCLSGPWPAYSAANRTLSSE